MQFQILGMFTRNSIVSRTTEEEIVKLSAGHAYACQKSETITQIAGSHMSPIQNLASQHSTKWVVIPSSCLQQRITIYIIYVGIVMGRREVERVERLST